MSSEKSHHVPVEQLAGKMASRYKLVIGAAKRALELSQGGQKLVEGGLKDKPAITALREIADGKVELKITKKAKGG
jgi:DNA-directed RNA polymerase subunit omega